MPSTTAAARTLFEAAKIIKEKRNGAGRVTLTEARYSDGSGLRFTWSEGRGARLVELPAEKGQR
ncbi:hypothetical protein HNP60_001970 [Sphingobium sp. B1D3A]|uniref:Uncharacterized protein n=1 Tax=Sphingobium lignivorans TaxID=2735886 RepID=A0ABR6NFF8_9SPHN|nr:hypothetical protein [Sphingobium lignivorans]